MNEILENVGGLVDVEDVVEDKGVSSAGDGGSGVNDQLDTQQGRADAAAKKTFVTSCPGMDGGSSGGHNGNSTIRWTEQSSASLVEKLIHTLSHDGEGQNDAVVRLYLQQIRGHEETIRMREMQIDTLCQELAQSVQRVHALEMDLKVLKLLGTHHHRSQHHRKRSFPSLNSDSNAGGSTSSS